MQERTIHISSINRQKIRKNKPEDFIVKFHPVLKLDPNMQHESNQIKYSPDGGKTWKNINFVDGMYSYEDLELHIHHSMELEGDVPVAANGKKTFNIKMFFVSSSYRVIIELSNNFQLDLRNTEFGNLIGFDKKNSRCNREYSARLPNITNNIDAIYINCDIITGSILDGRFTNTLAVIPTSGIRTSYPFKFEPLRALFNQFQKIMCLK